MQGNALSRQENRGTTRNPRFFTLLHCAIWFSSLCDLHFFTVFNQNFSTVQFTFLHCVHCAICISFTPSQCNSLVSKVHFAFLHRAICISSLCAIYISAISSHAFSQNLNEHFVLSISAYFSQHQQFDEVHLIAKSVT